MSASQKFMGVVKGLILSYLLTIIMLFITAVVVYKVGISDKVLGILVVVIYIVATFAGGFVTGRKVREKRFLWGMVYGLTYISVALTVSVLFTGSGDREGIAVITKCIMCVAGGMLGGYAQLKKNFYFIYLCVIIPIYDIKREVYPE